MTILDGKQTANDIKTELAVRVDQLILQGKRPPHLAAVLVGNDGASLTYVGSKVRSCERIGYESTLIQLPRRFDKHANSLIDINGTFYLVV